MIKTRIIPTLLYKDYTLVKGVSFDSWRRVGSLMQAVKVYNFREVDEMVFLDISATSEGRTPDFELVDDFADECFMPLAVGGGIRSIDDIKKLLRCGADKVVINTTAIRNPDVIKEASNKFGAQCVVISIDARKKGDKYEVFINSGKEPTGREVSDFAKEMELLGAGEILITSIEKDGTMNGYDVELVSIVTGSVSIPVIASGGAGNGEHMLEVLNNGHTSALAAASIFHFTEVTPIEIKHYLKQNGVDVRL